MSADDPGREAVWATVREHAEAALATTEVHDNAEPAEIAAAFGRVAQGFAAKWRDGRAVLAEASAVLRAGFTVTLRQTWGVALDELNFFIETADIFANDVVVNQPSEKRTLLTSVLLDLLAAACSCANEVHWLLAGGYATGAEARTRTLHELVATARILARFGVDDPPLVRRFVDHAAVGKLKYLRGLAKHHGAVGTDPPDDGEVRALADRVQQLKDETAPSFGKDYGWAWPHVPSGEFSDLEAKAGLSHRRIFFQIASNRAVHANANVLSTHHVERQGGYERLSNATTRGVERPGVLAAHWLWDVCEALIDGMKEVEGHGPGLGLFALREQRDVVTTAFEAAGS